MVLNRPRIRILTALAAAAVLAVAGCGSSSKSSSSASTAGASSAPAPAGAAPAAVKVDISGYKFVPATLVVKAGAKVTFTNSDSAQHTATAKDMSFDSGTLSHGQSKVITVSKPGTYPYLCQFHQFMSATITVQ